MEQYKKIRILQKTNISNTYNCLLPQGDGMLILRLKINPIFKNKEVTVYFKNDKINKSIKEEIPSNGQIDFLLNKTYYRCNVEASIKGVEESFQTKLLKSGITILEMDLNKELEKNSWETIKLASKNNIASSVWNIADKKQIIFDGKVYRYRYEKTEMYAYIIGFNHNHLVEGENLIHFMLGAKEQDNRYYVTLPMFHIPMQVNNFEYGNVSSSEANWENCSMRKNFCVEIYNGLPYQLRKNISEITKYSGNCNNVTGINTKDKIFLLSPVEVFGNNTDNIYKQNQMQYDFFKTHSKIHYKYYFPYGEQQIISCQWWLREKYDSSGYFYCVDAYGLLDQDQGVYVWPEEDEVASVVACFCI